MDHETDASPDSSNKTKEIQTLESECLGLHPALPFTSQATLSKPLNLSVPQFSFL